MLGNQITTSVLENNLTFSLHQTLHIGFFVTKVHLKLHSYQNRSIAKIVNLASIIHIN